MAARWSCSCSLAGSPAVAAVAPRGYGTDPDLVKSYRAGQLWPLTMNEAQRRTAAALCALIIPADEPRVAYRAKLAAQAGS